MILINSGYNRKQKFGAFSRYVPLSVPSGIGYIAAYLTKHKKAVKIVDEEVTCISEEMLDEYGKDLQRPYIFGISSVTAGITRAHELANIIKRKYPDSKVMLGGVHPTVLPGEVLKDENIDIVVRSEGEEIVNVLEEIVNVLYERIKNNRDYADIKGISFRKNGITTHNENAQLPDLEKVPGLPYHLFAKSSNRYELGFVASARGCPYNCIFCGQRVISGKRYRFFPPEVVVQSIEDLIFKYKCPHINFLDDSFLTNKERILRLCDVIKKRGLHKKVTFDCQARGDTVDEQILKVLKETSFRTINFGIETASERLMELIDKRETVQQIVDGIKLTKKIGFQVSGTFILGLPTESKEERMAAYKLTKELSLDYVRFNNATPYPGTKLYEIAKQENRLNLGDNWENLNACGVLASSPFKKSPLAYVPLTTSEKELRQEILKYNLFYSFRPQSILKILKERIGPSGWLCLPQKWYLKPKEWVCLIRLGFGILYSFMKVFVYDFSRFFRK